MLSFVKSLFLHEVSEDTNVEDSTTQVEKSDATLLRDQGQHSDEHETEDERGESNEKHGTSDGSDTLASLDSKSRTDTTKPSMFHTETYITNGAKVFTGNFFLVDGMHFESIMSECDLKIVHGVLYVHTANPSKSSTPSKLTINLSQIRGFQQHLANAFQFIAFNTKGEGGIEYGVEIYPPADAAAFRQCIYEGIISTADQVIGVECALAEYHTKDQEFVILSKTAQAAILKNTLGTDYYLTVSTQKSLESDEIDYYVIDFLSKDIQIWGSPSTNQTTFWTTHHKKSSMEKTMFLMEINPHVVGEASTSLFFSRLALILRDHSFLRNVEKKSNETIQDSQEESFSDNDGFDVGKPTDPEFCLEWKNGRRSTAPRHRVSYFSAESEYSQSDQSDEDLPLYNAPQPPMYTSEVSQDVLIHRFMDVGSKNTFVCRGNQPISSLGYKANTDKAQLQLKVYRRDETNDEGSGILQSVGVIEGKKFCHEGQTFVPVKGLLHQQERKMLLVPENGPKGDVFMMDLEQEKIVQKWNASNTQIATMFSTFKKGQESLDPTFLCANPRELFLMDTRMRDEPAKTVSYSYATNPQLSVGVTDAFGHILLGSRLGELRLFDGNANVKGDFKRAKTLLQAVKEPITSVDVNHDGSWILATTKTFLVVFPTRLVDSEKTGFEVPLGKKKPSPRYLMLSADDILKYQITAIDFSPAKFDATEESIVTSTGNMAVVWDFASVKRGQPIYSVRFAQDTIKDVQVPNHSADVVVAYPTAIGLFGTEKHRV